MATVLVRDDEDVLRALIRATLNGDACTVVEARDGDEAKPLSPLELSLVVGKLQDADA